MDAFSVAEELSGETFSIGREETLRRMVPCYKEISLEGATPLTPTLFLTKDSLFVSTAFSTTPLKRIVCKSKVSIERERSGSDGRKYDGRKYDNNEDDNTLIVYLV